MRPLSDELLEHLRHPRQVGPPPGGHDRQGEASNAACRDRLILYLAVRDGRVAAAGFKAAGCPAALGFGSAAVELLPGLAADAGLPDALAARFVERHGEPSPLHRHALVLVTDALQQALSPPPGGSAPGA